MLKPITVQDYNESKKRFYKKTHLVSCIFSYVALSAIAGKPLFFLDFKWQQYALFFFSIFIVGSVVQVLELIIEAWLGRIKFALASHALDEKVAHPRATAVMLFNFWHYRITLQVFSVVATVTGVVWCYQHLAPLFKVF